MEAIGMIHLHFRGKNSHEYLMYGTHLTVRPSANFHQGYLRKKQRVILIDKQTGQKGIGEILGYVTGVTVDKFAQYEDLLAMGPSHLREPDALIASLYKTFPDLPMDEWTFIAFKTYLIEVMDDEVPTS